MNKDFLLRTPPDRLILTPMIVDPNILWAPKRTPAVKTITKDALESLRCHIFDMDDDN
jgi:hypothetical protein